MYKSSLMAGLLLAVIGLTTACNSNKEREVGELKKRESGLQYKFLRLGEEQAPDSTQWLVMQMLATTANDSVIFDTKVQGQGMPIGIPVSAPNLKGMLAEGIKMLHKGDSAQFIVPAKDFFMETNGTPVPPGIDENADLTFNIGVSEVTDEAGYQQMQMEYFQRMQSESAGQQREQLVKDIKTIDKYLADKSIKFDTTASGVRVQVTQAGKGEKPKAGDNIVVHYRGKLLSGEQFDASYDRNEPFTFPVGQGQVIRGWDEGLMQLPKGSKATLYIPSPLAYGAQQRSEVIKPNSILVFDVEVLDVKKQ